MDGGSIPVRVGMMDGGSIVMERVATPSATTATRRLAALKVIRTTLLSSKQRAKRLSEPFLLHLLLCKSCRLLGALFACATAPEEDDNTNDEHSSKDHEEDLPPLEDDDADGCIRRGLDGRRGHGCAGNVHQLGQANAKPGDRVAVGRDASTVPQDLTWLGAGKTSL